MDPFIHLHGPHLSNRQVLRAMEKQNETKHKNFHAMNSSYAVAYSKLSKPPSQPCRGVDMPHLGMDLRYYVGIPALLRKTSNFAQILLISSIFSRNQTKTPK